MSEAPSSAGMGDRGFFRLNSRLEPEQLGAGDVSVSINGRMERGSWQPRRGIDNISGALQSDGDPLRLPFFLVDTPGGLAITSAERIGTEVSLEIPGHPFTPTTSAYLGVEGLTGTVDPNGVHLVEIFDSDFIGFEIPGAVGNETYGGSGVVRSVLDDTAAASIYGSCLFSDPSTNSTEFIIQAATGVAFLVEMADGTVTEVSYPSGEVLDGPAELLQAHDRVFLFQDGQQTWEWLTPLGRLIEAAEIVSNELVLTITAHGFSIGDSVVLSGIGFVTTDPNGTRVVTAVPDADTVEFVLTGANETYTDLDDAKATGGFTKVPAGVYTQPQVFEVTSTAVVVSSGLATITVVGNNTVETGDMVRIYGTNADSFTEFVGREFKCTAATSTTISFYIPVADTTTISTDFLSIGRQISVGAGFQNMPAPPWAVHHQRRLICPYRYSQTGTTDSPVFTDRDVRDELVISDILDPYTYDAIENQFKITGGTADFLVAVQPFYEDAAVVFMRNSIHAIFGLNGALSDCSTRELTRETGCLARKSVAMHGSEILFLSDNGVYAVSFIDQYNLRGVDLPLSDAIQPVIDRINADLAVDSVGIYFNNHYWLAVPLDSTPGSGDATGNNAILVYNFLNSGWESIDTVADSRWNILNFHISRAGQRNDLYVVNTQGGVHKIDAADRDSDILAIVPGEANEELPTAWELRTRAYDGASPERKRFEEVQVLVEASGQPCDATFAFSTEDPDSEQAVGSVTGSLGENLASEESASLRLRCGGFRGHSAVLSMTAGFGRPKLKNTMVKAKSTNKQTVNQQ